MSAFPGAHSARDHGRQNHHREAPIPLTDFDCAVAQAGYAHAMQIELEQEEDGRWIAEAPRIPGALAYGDTQREAISKVESLVLRILADRLDHGEMAPELEKVFTVAA